ncbi:MAG: TIGR01548 family HAD-type hydrolase [Cyanobium sp.]
MVSLPKVWKQTSNLPVQAACQTLSARAVLLFDIDGVIRDVAASYRRAIVETVHQFGGWRPEPAQIDTLKSEGCWNNDWEASLELLRRHRPSAAAAALPAFDTLVAAFCEHYFGGDPEGDPALWRGFIGQEPLLVGPELFTALSAAGFLWGFVSGAEPPSARYVLQRRLGLQDPPLIAMGDAPDKPDPTGLLRLAETLLTASGTCLGPDAPVVAYLGDTVADVQTVQRARERVPAQRFLSLAVSPPHLHEPGQRERRRLHEQQLLAAGADRILTSSDQVGRVLEALLD